MSPFAIAMLVMFIVWAIIPPVVASLTICAPKWYRARFLKRTITLTTQSFVDEPNWVKSLRRADNFVHTMWTKFKRLMAFNLGGPVIWAWVLFPVVLIIGLAATWISYVEMLVRHHCPYGVDIEEKPFHSMTHKEMDEVVRLEAAQRNLAINRDIIPSFWRDYMARWDKWGGR